MFQCVARLFIIDYCNSFGIAQEIICSSNRTDIQKRARNAHKGTLLLVLDQYIAHLFDKQIKPLKRVKSVTGVAFLTN